MNALVDALACWLCTFAAHSALLALLALGAGALLRERAIAWQETALRLALLGGMLTSCLQATVCGGPLIHWPATPAVAEGADVPPAAVSRGPFTPAGAPPAAPAPPVRLLRALADLPPAQLLVATAAGCALIGLSWLLRARARLLELLRDRVPEADPRVLRIAAAAARDLGFRRLPPIHRAAALGSPVTFGIVRTAVCLPERVDELGDEELRALLCHEFAHVRRGDTTWLWLGAAVQALFPWQFWLWPLRRRLCALAELRCDAEASRRSSPVAVAQCLVQVAAWLDARSTPVGALAMAARPSALRVRVEAALDERHHGRTPVAGSVLLAAGAVILFTAFAPGARNDPRMPRTAAQERAGHAAIVSPAAIAADAEALAALDDARARLVAEADALRREVAGNDDVELRQLLDLLQVRVAAMTRTGERLQAALAEQTNHGSTGSRRMR